MSVCGVRVIIQACFLTMITKRVLVLLTLARKKLTDRRRESITNRAPTKTALILMGLLSRLLLSGWMTLFIQLLGDGIFVGVGFGNIGRSLSSRLGAIEGAVFPEGWLTLYVNGGRESDLCSWVPSIVPKVVYICGIITSEICNFKTDRWLLYIFLG
jgi:hypothetical protein